MLQISFITVSLLSLILFYSGTGRDKRLFLFFVVWQLIVGTVSLAGIFKYQPTLLPLAIIGAFAILIFFVKKINTQKINTSILLSIHVLRIPVELILYRLYLQNKIPELMTFSGWNFDILTGISAFLLLLYIVLTKRKLNSLFFLVWNIIGILFLLIIVSLAILSAPFPIQQFAFNQPNIAVLEFPYCFLPTCVVPIVLLSHLLLTGQQRKRCR